MLRRLPPPLLTHSPTLGRTVACAHGLSSICFKSTRKLARATTIIPSATKRQKTNKAISSSTSSLSPTVTPFGNDASSCCSVTSNTDHALNKPTTPLSPMQLEQAKEASKELALARIKTAEALLASPRKVLTKSLFCDAVVCPKKGFFSLMEDQENALRSAQRVSQRQLDNATEADARSQGSKQQFLDKIWSNGNKRDTTDADCCDTQRQKAATPGLGSFFNAADFSSTNIKKRSKDSNNGGDDFDINVDSLRGEYVHAFARKWHRFRFARDMGKDAPIHNLASLPFEERCVRTWELVEKHVLLKSPAERTEPLALQEASFSYRFPDTGVELRITCDLLHFLPHGHFFLNRGNSRKSNDAEGAFELIEVKSAMKIESATSARVFYDIAFQKYVLDLCGLPVHDAGVLHPSQMHRRVTTRLDTVGPGVLSQFFHLIPFAGGFQPPERFASIEATVKDVTDTLWPLSTTTTMSSSSSSSSFSSSTTAAAPDAAAAAAPAPEEHCYENMDDLPTVPVIRSEWANHFQNSSSGSLEDFGVLSQRSVCGAHCSGTSAGGACRFMERCVPSATMLPGNVFGLPMFSIDRKRKLWNRGVRYAADLVEFSSAEGATQVSDRANKSKKSKKKTSKTDDDKVATTTTSSSSSPSSSSSAKAEILPLTRTGCVEWDNKKILTRIAISDDPRSKEILPRGGNLSKPQLRFATACAANAPVVSVTAVDSFINSIRYPLISLDFECAQFAAPPFDNYNVYEHLPFQFSAHVIESKEMLLAPKLSTFRAAVKHREFLYFAKFPHLDVSTSDPRPAIAHALTELFKEFSSTNPDDLLSESDLVLRKTAAAGKKPATTAAKAKQQQQRQGEKTPPRKKRTSRNVYDTKENAEHAGFFFGGTVLCHNASYEQMILTRLANQFEAPTFAPQFHPKHLHFIDSVDLVKQGVTFPGAGGSASLKKIVPLVSKIPEVRGAYDASEGHFVTEGTMAADVYWLLVTGHRFRNEQVAGQVRKELLRYCAADSFGTLEIIREAARLTGLQ